MQGAGHESAISAFLAVGDIHVRKWRPGKEAERYACDVTALDARVCDRARLVMHSCEISTPVGRLLLAGDEKGLRRISFQDGLHPVEVDEGWQRTEEPFREAIAQIDAYFAGRLDRFDLALAPEGTSFQREVWSALTTIPYGETVSYGELARHLGRPAASRAVGAANGRNPIPIVIPCHRVVGADGSLTGFGGGLAIKRRLLELEARDRTGVGSSRLSLPLFS
jgi:methylated-DNA-[protein]-cysteine S-methyltransferase